MAPGRRPTDRAARNDATKEGRAAADLSASQARFVSAVVEWKRMVPPDPNPRRWVVYVDNNSDAPITVEDVLVRSGSSQYTIKDWGPSSPRKRRIMSSRRQTSIRRRLGPRSPCDLAIRSDRSGCSRITPSDPPGDRRNSEPSGLRLAARPLRNRESPRPASRQPCMIGKGCRDNHRNQTI